MFKEIMFYLKIGLKLLRKDIVCKEDYRRDYNQVSDTYVLWLNRMGQFTDRIIADEHMISDKQIKILDFACGTGYISQKVLEQDTDCELIAVDYSEKMQTGLSKLKDDRLRVINCDGIEFLKNTNEKYDTIYFAWALSYFDHTELFQLFRKVLNPGGKVHIITNVQGTLEGIESIFLKVMYKRQEQVAKPMDIKFNLPNGKKGLTKWFSQYGFEQVKLEEEEEEIVTFDEAEELLDWLSKTGAIAGTSHIFKNYSIIKEDLLDEIRKTKYRDGKYEINHKFVYGTYRLDKL